MGRLPSAHCSLDSWTFYGVRVLRDLERKFDTYDLWAEYLRRMTNLALDLSESTQPHPTDSRRPVYHHVATVHEDPDQKRVGTGKEQELVTVNMAPALQGKARKLLFSQYDAVLNLTKETKPVRDEDNKMVRQDRWWAWSVSPDELHQDCKDSIGGGRFNPLPYRVPNGDFVSLATAWGLPDELIQEARDTASWKPRDVNNNTNNTNTKENHSA